MDWRAGGWMSVQMGGRICGQEGMFSDCATLSIGRRLKCRASNLKSGATVFSSRLIPSLPVCELSTPGNMCVMSRHVTSVCELSSSGNMCVTPVCELSSPGNMCHVSSRHANLRALLTWKHECQVSSRHASLRVLLIWKHVCQISSRHARL